MLLVSQAEETAEIVLGITDRMRTFTLVTKIRFDQTRERRQRLVVGRRRAMLWISTVQGCRQDPHSRLDIFPGIGG